MDIKILEQFFDYNPQDGTVLWRRRTPDSFNPPPKSKRSREHICSNWNATYAGKPAFVTRHGIGACGTSYLQCRVYGKNLFAHRVAWALHTGKWPELEIDHINGDRSDNRTSNLREVNHSTNAKNTKRRSDNKTGVTGVSWARKAGLWRAEINRRFIGLFKSFPEAVAARKTAEKLHGFHPNHGRVAGNEQMTIGGRE